MPIDRYDPVPHIVLRAPDVIAAYANPTRIAILGILSETEATLSMVAARLGTPPANLSHHIRKLLENRLIVLIETRATAKNVEKYYRATAYSYSIEMEDAESADDRALELAKFRGELVAAVSRRMRGKAAGAEEQAFARVSLARIRPSDAASFRSRLEALAEEFSDHDDAQGEGYALGLSLFRSSLESE